MERFACSGALSDNAVMGRDLPGTLRGISRQQSGILSRQQVLKAGLSAETVRSKVKTGQWRRIYRGVYAVQPGRVTRRAELWAAVLAALPVSRPKLEK